MEDERKHARVDEDKEEFLRYPLSYRLQHFVLMLTLLVLLATGLPLLYPDSKLSQSILLLPEWFTLRGQIHRAAAVALIAFGVWHILFLIFSDKGHEDIKEMMPRGKDFRNGIGSLRLALGMAKERPPIGRFNLMQKLHYCLLAFGVILMICTGFIIWFPEEVMLSMPKWVVDVAFVCHGAEGLFAFVILMIWHIYTVHFTPENFPMSKVWLTGKITAKQLKSLYPLEYERLVREKSGERKKNG